MRFDDGAERALAALEASGLTRSEAVRAGLQPAARQLRDRQKLAREAQSLALNDGDVAEAGVVREMMEDLRAPW